MISVRKPGSAETGVAAARMASANARPGSMRAAAKMHPAHRRTTKRMAAGGAVSAANAPKMRAAHRRSAAERMSAAACVADSAATAEMRASSGVPTSAGMSATAMAAAVTTRQSLAARQNGDCNRHKENRTFCEPAATTASETTPGGL